MKSFRIETDNNRSVQIYRQPMNIHHQEFDVGTIVLGVGVGTAGLRPGEARIIAAALVAAADEKDAESAKLEMT